MIAIIDYGSGNIRAFVNILRRLEIDVCIARTADDLQRATKIILPGVGIFDQTVGHLSRSGLTDALQKRVIEDRIPFLGVCVGMQLLAECSEEGDLPGLGWIRAKVRRFDTSSFPSKTHLPHMGWNEISPRSAEPIFAGLDAGASFYFLHSFYVECTDSATEIAVADYGGNFTCAVRKDNIWGVQFHPEKSHDNGVRLLANFARRC